MVRCQCKYYIKKKISGKHSLLKWYNPDSLYAYIHQITEEKNLEKESFDELLNILLGMYASIEIIIEICTYGLLNSYKCEAGIEYIGNHLWIL